MAAETPYATRIIAEHGNPLLNVYTYWRVSGLALAVVAVLGIIVNALFGDQTGIPGFLEFDWAHNILHVVLAALALSLGFGGASFAVARSIALLVGGVYLVLGLIGSMAGGILGFAGLYLQAGENIFHILIGVWGIIVGLSG